MPIKDVVSSYLKKKLCIWAKKLSFKIEQFFFQHSNLQKTITSFIHRAQFKKQDEPWHFTHLRSVPRSRHLQKCPFDPSLYFYRSFFSRLSTPRARIIFHVFSAEQRNDDRETEQEDIRGVEIHRGWLRSQGSLLQGRLDTGGLDSSKVLEDIGEHERRGRSALQGGSW